MHTADYTHSELFLTLTEPRVFIYRGGYKYFSNLFHLFCKQAITLSYKLHPEVVCSVSPHFFFFYPIQIYWNLGVDSISLGLGLKLTESLHLWGIQHPWYPCQKLNGAYPRHALTDLSICKYLGQRHPGMSGSGSSRNVSRKLLSSAINFVFSIISESLAGNI